MSLERSVEGTLVGDAYRVRRLLAEGGMSVILDANHLHTRQRVAIKVLPTDKRNNSEFIGRHERELHLLRRARGIGVVELLDAGVCPAYGPYIVMEFLSGRPLDGILAARHHLSLDETLTVLEPLARTIARLHDQGIVHRDLKPSNFFVERTAQSERTVLLDFGVSSLLSTDAEPDITEPRPSAEKLTTRGELLGTIEYMSPEQIMAQHDDVDVRSDVFCFGVSMFEMLTGEMPFGVDWVQRVESMRQSVEPSFGELADRMPEEVKSLVSGMLAFNPQDRPQSMHHVHQALLGVIAGLPNARLPAPLLAGLSGAPRASKRLHQRAAYVAPIRLKSGSQVIDGRTEDISEGGVLVTSKATMPTGERVVARFALPMDGRVVQLAGVVRWAREGRGLHAIGLSWTDPPADAAASLRAYVDLMLDPAREAVSITLLEFQSKERDR